MPDRYPQTIVRRAQTEVPNHFKEVPHVRALRCKQYIIKNDNYRGKGGWLKGTLTTMLAVGDYGKPAKNSKPPVCAFVHGEKKNRVGYFYTLDEPTFVEIQPRALVMSTSKSHLAI
jgi:hypothetical protein